ncbi:guanine exchange factor for Rac 30-like [Saccostrea cucullata]|uniref:guanine exchange factor for Rac 30-like n=1 Tax=Saccostrea cuccullata TaxID=36930 RepID=UPI002ED5B179
MAALFPNGTDEKCSCTKAFNLHYEGFTDYTTMDCVRYQHSSPYRGALAHLLDYQQAVRPTAQICHSHTSVWRELNNILQHNDRGVRCLENLISHLYVSVFHQGDPCSCHAVSTTTKATTQPSTATITTTTSTTTTTLPSTTTTTTLPTTTNSPSTTTATTSKPTITSTETTNSHSTTTSQSTECSKIRTVTELGKFQQLYPEFNTNCSRRISTSNLIVRDLCDFVPISKYWKPGKKGWLAGGFLGCTNTSLRIATQECGGKFEIQEFAHMPHILKLSHILPQFLKITY